MAVISMKQLLEAGVHFGHQTRRWNPKMKKYIFTERNGIYIIDLQKTVKLIDDAYDFMKDAAANDGVILFVGTKKQAQDAIEEEAKRAGQYYVNHRWLGGTLTNWNTIQKRIKRLSSNCPGAVYVNAFISNFFDSYFYQVLRTKLDGVFGCIPQSRLSQENQEIGRAHV